MSDTTGRTYIYRRFMRDGSVQERTGIIRTKRKTKENKKNGS